jgi:hypothetical protein
LDKGIFERAIIETFLSLPGSSVQGKLAGELVREIGLRLPQPYDLFANVNPALVRFNSPQTILFLIDAYSAFQEQSGLDAVTARSSAEELAAQAQATRASIPRLFSSDVPTATDTSRYSPCVWLQGEAPTLTRARYPLDSGDPNMLWLA